MLDDSCCRSSCDYPQSVTRRKKKRQRRRSRKSSFSSWTLLPSPQRLWMGGWLYACRYGLYPARKLGRRPARRLECWTPRPRMPSEGTWQCRRGSWRERRGKEMWRRRERESVGKWQGRCQRRTRGRGGCQEPGAPSWGEEEDVLNENSKYWLRVLKLKC